MACKHFDCICYNQETETCDYILIFGRRRGIPGDQCHLRLHGFDDEHRPINKGTKAKAINFKVLNALEEAYSPKLTAYEIARKAGANRDLTVKWIRKVHPEFNNWGILYSNPNE